MKTLYLLTLLILILPLSSQDKEEVKPKSRIEILQEEIQKRPENAELHLQLGMEYLNSSNSENAQKELELSKKLFGKDVPFLLYRKLGEAYYDQSKYEEAMQEFLKAQEKIQGEWESKGYLNICNAKHTIAGLGNLSAEEMANAEFKLVEAYYEMGWHSFAKSDLETLMEKIPDNQIYKKMYEKVTKADKAKTLFGEANDYYAQGKYKKSLEKSTESFVIYKDIGNRRGEAATLITSGIVYFLKGDYKKASDFYEKSLVISKEIGDGIIEAANLNTSGIVYFLKGDNKKALDFYEKSLAISKEIGDRYGEAISFGEIGEIYDLKGDYKKALAFYKKSLAISKEIGKRIGQANYLSKIGSVYYLKGDYKKALEFQEKSLAISKEIGDRSGEASALMGMGNVYESKGDYKTALDFYEKSFAINKEFEDGRRGEANNLNNIGTVYYSKGDYKTALDFYEKSFAINKEFENRSGEASNFHNIGTVHSSKGDYKKALDFYKKSLAISKEYEDRSREAESLNNIGNIYYYQGEYEKFYQSIEEVLIIAKEIESKYVELVCYIGFGEYYQITGDNEKAIEQYSKALLSAEGLGTKDRIAETNHLISVAYRKNKDYKKVIEYLDKSISIYKQIDKKPSLVTAYISYARIFLEQNKSGAKQYIQKAEEIEKVIGRKPKSAEIHLLYAQDFLLSKEFPEAERETCSALKIAEELGSPATTWEAYKTLGDIQLAADKKKESIESYKKSIAILRSIFSLLGSKNQSGYMQDKLDVYESLIKLLIEAGKHVEARKYLEESRQFILRANRKFLEEEKIQDVKTKIINEEVNQKKIELDNLEKKIQVANNAGQVEALKTAKKNVHRAYLNKLEELRGSSEEGKKRFDELSLNYEKNVDFNEVLSKDTVLVEYVLLDTVTYIFCFEKEKSPFFTSVPVGRKEIGDLVKAFRNKIIEDNNLRNWKSEESQKLYKHLIEPIQKHLKKHIVFMPYGVLYSLPFEALTLTDNRYLVEDHDVSYYTNISAMRILREKKKIAVTEKIVIAFAPPVQNLPNSVGEVLGIGEKFPKASKILTKEKATIDTFEKEAREYYIVHLSTHGNLCLPIENSNLEFSSNYRENLTLSKIRQLNSPKGFERTQLVVMSACETAIGSKAIGPDENFADYAVIPLSLSQAFESIRVYAIIGTLWKVQDLASKDLMIDFYDKLKANQFKTVEALSQAKREYIQYNRKEKSVNVNPYYWAGFILTGDYR
ncbi:MAG: tetratricopeptide repeat protein [Leptospiraceae bacterium]|nr:tetratricopeptide repeat protein [Leptospiraceae bacterium]